MLSAGNLDSTFGDGGVVQLDGTQVVQMDTSCSALQSDGKILLGGASINGGGDGVFSEIARLNSNGQLDTSFGQDGQVPLVENGLSYLSPIGLGVTADHQIVVAAVGYREGAQKQYLALTRLTASGVVDTSFGSDGWLTLPVPSGGVNAMQLAPNGDIYVAGDASVGNSQSTNFAVTRFLPDGELDTSFARYGHAIISFSETQPGVNDPYASATALANAPDGSVVVAGNGAVGGYAVKLTARGRLDRTFGMAGRFVTNMTGGFNAVTLGADGEIYLAGTETTGAYAHALAVTALNAWDQIVKAFGSDGLVEEGVDSGKSHPSDVTVSAIEVSGSSNILVAGAVEGRYGSGPFIVQLKADGGPDKNFGDSGASLYSAVPRTKQDYPFALQSEGLLVNTDDSVFVPYDGYLSADAPTFSYSLRAVKFDPDGSVDDSFADHGVASVITTGRAGDRVLAFAPQSSGNLLAISQLSDQQVLQNYTAAGSASNLVTIGTGYYPSPIIAGDAQGRILMASGTSIYRYLANGTLDASFGQSGSTGFDPFGGLRQITPLADGSLLTLTISGSDAPDTTFSVINLLNSSGNTTASVSAQLNEGDGSIIIRSAITPTGKIKILALYLDQTGGFSDSQGTLRLVQYNADLSVDASFGSDGSLELPNLTDDESSLIVAPDGSIYVTGDSLTGIPIFSLARVTPGGALDTSFGTGGYQTLFPNLETVLVQPDSKLLVAADNGTTITLTRYNTDFSLDSTFGDDGVSTLSIGTSPISDALPPIFAVGEVTGAAKLYVAGATDRTAIPSDAATGGDQEGFLARIDL